MSKLNSKIKIEYIPTSLEDRLSSELKTTEIEILSGLNSIFELNKVKIESIIVDIAEVKHAGADYSCSISMVSDTKGADYNHTEEGDGDHHLEVIRSSVRLAVKKLRDLNDKLA